MISIKRAAALAALVVTTGGCAFFDRDGHSSWQGWAYGRITDRRDVPLVADCQKELASDRAFADARYATVAYRRLDSSRYRVALLPSAYVPRVRDAAYVNIDDCRVPLVLVR